MDKTIELEKIEEMLKELTEKEFVCLTERGNKSIKLALEIAKSLGKTKCILQDQGGWMTYKQFAEKLKLEIVEVKTDSGIIKLDDMRTKADENSVLLINSMPAYAFLEDMKEILKIAHQKECLVINDASGSIGTSEAKHGDIVLGSFGEGKPVNLDYGGFIATDNDEIYDKFQSNFDSNRYDELLDKLVHLDEKLAIFRIAREKILKELSELDIIRRESKGINVIIRYKNDIEKQRITDYCVEHDLEYTECPRYIRVNEKAISVEVKKI